MQFTKDQQKVKCIHSCSAKQIATSTSPVLKMFREFDVAKVHLKGLLLPDFPVIMAVVTVNIHEYFQITIMSELNVTPPKSTDALNRQQSVVLP